MPYALCGNLLNRGHFLRILRTVVVAFRVIARAKPETISARGNNHIEVGIKLPRFDSPQEEARPCLTLQVV
jgi:hypothetical protein